MPTKRIYKSKETSPRLYIYVEYNSFKGGIYILTLPLLNISVHKELPDYLSIFVELGWLFWHIEIQYFKRIKIKSK